MRGLSCQFPQLKLILIQLIAFLRNHRNPDMKTSNLMIRIILETVAYRKNPHPILSTPLVIQSKFTFCVFWTDVKRKKKVSIILQQTTKNNNNTFAPSCTNFAYLVIMLKLLQNTVLPNSECDSYYMCNGRLPARCKWGLHLFGMLRSVDYLTTQRYVTSPKSYTHKITFLPQCMFIFHMISKRNNDYVYLCIILVMVMKWVGIA